MTPDHEIDWTAAGKLAENWARLCYPETPEGNLSRAYLDAMARLAEWEATARKLTNGLCSDREELEGFIEEMVDILKGELAPLEARLDEALALARFIVEESDCEREADIRVKDAAHAFLAKHRKTGANDGK